MFNTEHGCFLHEFKRTENYPLNSLCFNSSSKFLVSSSDFGMINVYSLKEIDEKIKASNAIKDEDDLKKFEKEFKEDDSV